MVGFCHGGNMPASHYYHHYYYHYHHYYYIIIIISQYHHDLSNLIKIPPPVLNHMLVQLLIKLGHRLQIGKLFNRLETRISFFYKYLNAGVILGYPTHTHFIQNDVSCFHLFGVERQQSWVRWVQKESRQMAE